MTKRKGKNKGKDANNADAPIPKRRRQEIEDLILNKARPFIDRKPSHETDEPISSDNRNISHQVRNGDIMSKTKHGTTSPSSKHKNNKKTKLPVVANAETHTRALEYLNSWSIKDGHWRYKKKLHTWFLQNMYKKEKVSDDSFPTLLDYLESLKGPPRLKVIQQAEGIIKDCDCQMDPMNADIPAACLTGYARARQVLQLIV